MGPVVWEIAPACNGNRLPGRVSSPVWKGEPERSPDQTGFRIYLWVVAGLVVAWLASWIPASTYSDDESESAFVVWSVVVNVAGGYLLLVLLAVAAIWWLAQERR